MTLLTAKQVQEIFRVDRSTIYRMAEDGRLPAVKVGRQWRFPSEHLESLLGQSNGESTPPSPAVATSDHVALRAILPGDTAQAVADLAADLFGVMAVVTDMQGQALTTVANPCGYFDAVFDGVYTADRCSTGWRRLGEEIDLEPRFLPSHLGFLCARSFIRVGTNLAGMVIVGGVAPGVWPPDDAEVAAIAAETGATEQTIRDHIDEVYWIDQAHQDWIVRNLSRVSDLISHLADGHGRLIQKLETIAALAGSAGLTEGASK
ncbi:MAG: helix-turn-helix domain-containing protein [Acidimicrobiia bacterium]|nr:helix-turn-helix domain-containing protein [Acidimicrobiia bacterium]